MPECEKCKSKSTYEDGRIHHVKGCEYWDEAPQTSEAVVPLNDLLCDLKSQHIRNVIGGAVEDLEKRIAHHDSGYMELIPEALQDYQDDLKLLKELGA